MHRFVLRVLRSRTADRREPDVYIGGRQNTYLRRWWIIPKNPFLNIFLHQFLRSDYDRALHDHPWWNFSWVLDGGYYEITAVMPKPRDAVDAVDLRGLELEALSPGGARRKVLRRPGDMALRLAKTAHRIELRKCCEDRPEPHELPAWSLFITGPKIRTWGFFCKEGWVPFNTKARAARPNDSDGPCE